jgi:hypothetical protein
MFLRIFVLFCSLWHQFYTISARVLCQSPQSAVVGTEDGFKTFHVTTNAAGSIMTITLPGGTSSSSSPACEMPAANSNAPQVLSSHYPNNLGLQSFRGVQTLYSFDPFTPQTSNPSSRGTISTAGNKIAPTDISTTPQSLSMSKPGSDPQVSQFTAGATAVNQGSSR